MTLSISISHASNSTISFIFFVIHDHVHGDGGRDHSHDHAHGDGGAPQRLDEPNQSTDKKSHAHP